MKKIEQEAVNHTAVYILITFFIFLIGGLFFSAVSPAEASEVECSLSVFKWQDSGLRGDVVYRGTCRMPAGSGATLNNCLGQNGYSASDKTIGGSMKCDEVRTSESSVPPPTSPSYDSQIEDGKAQIEDKLGIDLDKLKGIEGEVRDRLKGIENEINTEDGVDASEVKYVVGRIVAVVKDIFRDKVGDTFGNIKDKVGGVKDKVVNKIPFIGDNKPKWGTDIDGDGITDFDPDEDNPFDEIGSFENVGFNKFDTRNWPDENGVKIAKIVDPYGKEQYTSDGKHFYKNAYDAAHSGSGFSNVSNKIGDTWSDFKSIFSFKTKLSDKDKELQREIAREVLKDAKSQKEKDVEKAYEKLSAKFKTPKYGDVPAKAVIDIAKEASETDFAGGVLVYIEERKKGKSMATIRENTSEELSGGYGTFGKGVSLSTVNKYAKAVIYARYEESYQRYLLAKEFGRKK